MNYLEEVAARLNAASPGVWRHIPGDSYCAYPHVRCGDKTLIFEDHGDHECSTHHCEEGYPGKDEDAEFIAHSRDDIYQLLRRLTLAVSVLEEVTSTDTGTGEYLEQLASDALEAIKASLDTK